MVKGITDSRLQEIYILNAAGSVLSLFGCIFIISMYYIYKDLRKLAFKLIAILSIFDLINAISFLIPTYQSNLEDSVCVVQGILMNFSTFAAVLWTTFIAITLYSIVVKSYLQIDLIMKKYFIFNIFASCFITALPNIFDSTSPSSRGYCWLYRGGDQPYLRFRFITFLAPLWAIIFINIILYIMVFRYLRSADGGDDAKTRRQLSNKIGIYPLIIIICYLPYTIKGLIEVTGSWDVFAYEYYFTLIAGFIRCLIGLFNAIAYGLTKTVKKKIKKILCNNNSESIKDTLMAEVVAN